MPGDSTTTDGKPPRFSLGRRRTPSAPSAGTAPARRPAPPGQAPPVQNRFRSRNFLLIMAVLFGVNILLTNVILAPSQPKSVVIPYDVFVKQVTADNVTSVTSTSDAIAG